MKLEKILEICSRRERTRKDDLVVCLIDKEDKIIEIKSYKDLTYEECFLIEFRDNYDQTINGLIKVKMIEYNIKEYGKRMKKICRNYKRT